VPRRTQAGYRGRVSDVARVEIADGNLERALRMLRKQTDRAGVFRALKAHEHFTPPGERRRIKAKRARKRNTKRTSSDE
jgi:ribosomal protein S21